MALPPVFVEFLGSTAGFMAASKEVQGEMTKVESQGAGTWSKVGAGALIAVDADQHHPEATRSCLAFAAGIDEWERFGHAIIETAR